MNYNNRNQAETKISALCLMYTQKISSLFGMSHNNKTAMPSRFTLECFTLIILVHYFRET